MKLVIAEKPSVAQSLAAVLGAKERGQGYLQGNGYIVSWCIGHLIGLAAADSYDAKYSNWCYEDLPIIPKHWKYTVAPDKKEQYEVLVSLMNRTDVESLVCATDAGREGELIFRLVYDHKEEHILSLERSLTEQDTDSIRGYLLDFANGDRGTEGFADAEMLLKQMDALIPQKSGTVLNLYGSMGFDYNMIRITNMEPEQVKAVLEEMIGTIPEEQIDNVEAYLEQAGAHIEQIGGSYNDFSPHFPVMLEYDFDANQVYVPAAEPELGTFTIYQLKSGEELHYHRFEPLERLERFGLFVDPDNYEKVYTADVPEDGSIMMKLENIYKTFNLHRPEDFKGHSLSVSDVVVLHQEGKDTAFYVDSIGFEEVPAFFKQEPDRFRYYITEDSVQRGTYPYVDETALKRFTSQLHKYEQGTISAYGYLEYSKPLTEEQIKDYALTPSPQNHLETVEKTEEQNYNQIDGILRGRNLWSVSRFTPPPLGADVPRTKT